MLLDNPGETLGVQNRPIKGLSFRFLRVRQKNKTFFNLVNPIAGQNHYGTFGWGSVNIGSYSI
jgi:hypothetical protein